MSALIAWDKTPQKEGALKTGSAKGNASYQISIWDFPRERGVRLDSLSVKFA